MNWDVWPWLMVVYAGVFMLVVSAWLETKRGQVRVRRIAIAFALGVPATMIAFMAPAEPSRAGRESPLDVQERSISGIVAGTDPRILATLTTMLAGPGGWMEINSTMVCQPGPIADSGTWAPTCLWRRDGHTVLVFERTNTPTRMVFAGWHDPEAVQIWDMAQQRVTERQQQTDRERADRERPNLEWSRRMQTWLDRNAAQR